jgi:hypothetical protein
MTILKNRPAKALEQRLERLLRENREHLLVGRWAQYVKNCNRIARLSAELNRRRHRDEREARTP